MRNQNWKEILNKCFGKEKDDRYHAIAMLAIYGFFIFILIVAIRMSGFMNSNSLQQENKVKPSSTPIIEKDSSSNSNIYNYYEIMVNHPNYSYSYIITYNGITEVYLGKKVNQKEKFTVIQNGILVDYAILDGHYFVLEDGHYQQIEQPNLFFKYCDINQILVMLEDEIPTENKDTIKYSVSNISLGSIFKEQLLLDNMKNNLIQLSKSNGILKSMDLDFSNYISSVHQDTENLTIHMDFLDIGTTDDFEISHL